MFEIFRMDIRRMYKDKKFYAILICIFFAAFLFRLICAPSAVPFLNMLTGEVESNLSSIVELARMPQIEFLQTIMHSGFLSLLYCFYMGMFICEDFEGGFYKHIFSIHAKASHYIIAKLMLSSFLALVVCITVGFSTFLISYIPAFKLPTSSLMEWLVLLVQEWGILTAFGTMMLFFGLIIKNKAIVSVSIIAGGGLLIYIVSILANVINRPEIEVAVLKYSLFGAGNNCMAVYDVSSFWRTIFVSVIWILIYTILGKLILNRKF
ncbi:hypothetical protein KWK86_004640 [Clostridioides difficile]|nr:hypothetical protein [Clostridioides difficile]